jgi:hypothetical protein
MIWSTERLERFRTWAGARRVENRGSRNVIFFMEVSFVYILKISDFLCN